MKKITFTLALAAFAASPVIAQVANEVSVFNAGEFSNAPKKATSSFVMQKKSSAAPARISAVSDLYGQYEVNCRNLDQENVTYGPVVTAGSTANEVIFNNFPYADLEYPAIVDINAGTITFRPMDTGVYNTTYGENQFFGPMGFTPVGDNLQFTALQELVATINEDGSIELPPYNNYVTGFGMYISQGFFAGFVDMTITPIVEFVYNPSDWKDCCKGMFEESILNTLIVASGETPVAPYEVDVLVSKTNPALYLIKNPYHNSAWAADNETPNAEGFIMLDASEPDCVLCQPFVATDLGMDLLDTGTPEQVGIFNMEALMVRQGYEIQDIIDEYVANDEPVSNYDEKESKFSIYNNRFALASAWLTYYTWRDVTMLPSYLTLNFAGVDGIEADNSNAPVKYYNLQGVEVANPEQGQLVIKKQGSKAEKIVVR